MDKLDTFMFLDTQTMKVSYAFAPGDRPGAKRLEFDTKMQQAFEADNDQTHVYRVVVE